MHAQKLSDAKAKAAKPGPKVRKLSDGRGLYLAVLPSGAKSWRYDYRLNGQRQTLVLGTYPALALKGARRKHADAIRAVEDNQSPAREKQKRKVAARKATESVFRKVVELWLKDRATECRPATVLVYRRALNRHVLGRIGDKPIDEISAADVLAIIGGIKKTAPQMAEAVRHFISQIFDFAGKNLLTEANPARIVRGSVTLKPTISHRPMTEAEIGRFYDAVDALDVHPSSKIAARLLLLTGVRKMELVGARWSEIDFGDRDRAPTWTIPAPRMKGGLAHVVPLSRQAVAGFRMAEAYRGSSEFVFPHRADPSKHFSHFALNYVFKLLKFEIPAPHSKDPTDMQRAVPHSTRATFSTICNENRKRSDVIERTLAHQEANRIRRTYNRAELLDERRELLQWWADFIDERRAVENSRNVVRLRKAPSSRSA